MSSRTQTLSIFPHHYPCILVSYFLVTKRLLHHQASRCPFREGKGVREKGEKEFSSPAFIFLFGERRTPQQTFLCISLARTGSHFPHLLPHLDQSLTKGMSCHNTSKPIMIYLVGLGEGPESQLPPNQSLSRCYLHKSYC